MFEKIRTSLAEAFQFIRYSKDKEKLAEVIAQDADYEHLDRRTVEVINEVAKAGIQIPQGAEEVNVCIAIQEMKKEAEDKGEDYDPLKDEELFLQQRDFEMYYHDLAIWSQHEEYHDKESDGYIETDSTAGNGCTEDQCG